MNYTNRGCECCSCYRPQPIPRQATGCCGLTGIYEALIALQKSIAQINIPGFGVNVHITMVTGQEYNVLFAAGIPNPPEVKCGILTAGNLTLSLCDISKINIQTSTLNNPEFIKILNYYLEHVTTAMCSEECNNEEDGACAKCTQGIQCEINTGKTIREISYNGSQDNLIAVNSINQVTKTSVVGNAQLSTVGGNFVTGGSLVTTPQKVVTSVTATEVSALTGGNTSTITFVQGVNTTTATAAAPLTVTPTTVVASLVTVPVVAVTDITTTTGTVVNNVTPTTATGVASVTATTATGVTSVVPTTASVLASLNVTTVAATQTVTVTTGTAVLSVTSTTGTVVSNVTSTTGTVVNNVTMTTNAAIGGFPDLTTVSNVPSGLDAITLITPTTVSIPVITSTGTGILEVVIPPNTFSNPATVTLNITVGGATIALSNPITANVLPTTAAVLGGATTVTITPSVVANLGAPTTITAVTNVTPITSTGIATVTPVTATGILTVTSTTGTVVTDVTSTTGTVVSDVTPVSTTAVTDVTSTTGTVVSNVTPVTATVVSNVAATTVTGVTGVTATTLVINGVASSAATLINNIATPATVSVLSGITPTTTATRVFADAVAATVSALRGITTATVIETVGLSTTTGRALTAATLNVTPTTVVQNITTRTVDVLSPVPEVLSGTITAAGNGILVVNDGKGDVNIYSECEITALNG